MISEIHQDMPAIANAKARLLALLRRKSVFHGEFVLSSGAKSSYYIDCRLTTLDPEGAWLVGRADRIDDREQRADRVFAAAVAHPHPVFHRVRRCVRRVAGSRRCVWIDGKGGCNAFTNASRLNRWPSAAIRLSLFFSVGRVFGDTDGTVTLRGAGDEPGRGRHFPGLARWDGKGTFCS